MQGVSRCCLDNSGVIVRNFPRARYLSSGNRWHPAAGESLAHLAHGALPGTQRTHRLRRRYSDSRPARGHEPQARGQNPHHPPACRPHLRSARPAAHHGQHGAHRGFIHYRPRRHRTRRQRPAHHSPQPPL